MARLFLEVAHEMALEKGSDPETQRQMKAFADEALVATMKDAVRRATSDADLKRSVTEAFGDEALQKSVSDVMASSLKSSVPQVKASVVDTLKDEAFAAAFL